MDVETTAMASAQDIKQDMLKKILVNSGAKREDYDKEGGGNEDEDEDEEGVDEEGEGRGGREEGGTGSPAGDEGIKVEANNGSESVLGNLVEDNDLDAHKPAAVMLEENSSVLFSQIFGGDTQQMVTTEYIPKEMHPPTEQETELNHALLIEDSSSNMPLVKETSLNVSNSSGTLVIPPLPLKALVTADMVGAGQSFNITCHLSMSLATGRHAAVRLGGARDGGRTTLLLQHSDKRDLVGSGALAVSAVQLADVRDGGGAGVLLQRRNGRVPVGGACGRELGRRHDDEGVVQTALRRRAAPVAPPPSPLSTHRYLS